LSSALAATHRGRTTGCVATGVEQKFLGFVPNCRADGVDNVAARVKLRFSIDNPKRARGLEKPLRGSARRMTCWTALEELAIL